MKRTLASLICITLFFGMLAIVSLPVAGAAVEQYAGMGNYTVQLKADPSTATPSGFAVSEADGKVWVDKSVAAREDHFNVTLSALAQEYVSEDTTHVTESPAADVVMILDLSASMQSNSVILNGTSMTRTKAMVKAVNESLDIIMSANEKNRVLIYTYQSDSDNGKTPIINEFLPLGHYANSSWSDTTSSFSGNSGEYINYSTSGNNGRLQTNSSLKKDGSRFSQKSFNTGGGTCTQHGILKGIQALITAIGKEPKTIERKPYVLLFTDGAPGNVTTRWYNPSSTTCTENHENNGSPKISALTTLSAALMKDQLNAAYQTYNGKDMGIDWFNIGLGVTDADEEARIINGTLFLNPSTVATDTTTYGKNFRTNLEAYATGDYAAYKTNYVYANATDTYLINGSDADAGEKLNAAFSALAEKVEEDTKTITSPILSVEGASSDLTFTDTMGEGMTVSNITLSINGTALSANRNGNIFTFADHDTTATLSVDGQGRQVLTWNVPANEVGTYTFKNRENPDGNYIAAAPTSLSYQVTLGSKGDYAGQTAYSNTSATAQFSVPSDNPYYYAENGSLKQEPFASLVKTDNVSGTTGYHTAFATTPISEGTAITATLGNNGILTPSTLFEKEAEKNHVEVGTDATFLLHITNKSDGALTNLVITDQLPEGMTFKAGSEENAAVAVDGRNLTFTIAKIERNQIHTITYRATLNEQLQDGSALKNTAKITHINHVEVYNAVSSESTVTAYRTYRVTYHWTGDIPDDVALPTDRGRYTTGSSYPLDQTYSDQTKIENKDPFGNVTERWTFSGWSDPNRGVMGDADVTIRGEWQYESFTIPQYQVRYHWDGDIPDNQTIPTDDHRYSPNQPYPVDAEYSENTEIATYDDFGNLNGRYTFSGWADPQNGRMGNANVLIHGTWKYTPIEVPQYKVFYHWSGDIPDDQILPTNGNRYYPHQTYEVDDTHTANTEILSYDSYGNINGKTTFSGWTDPNNGVMGDADVTIAGVWTYEPIAVPDYQVIYTWSGNIPEDQTLPTDKNRYVPHQAYEVDSTHTANTSLPTYDSYGNINGKFTFSGWEDPNHGVMGNADVTIAGVWKYESIPVPDYSVKYNWSGNIPDGQTLPVDPNRYVPHQPYEVDQSYTAQTVIPDYDAYGNHCGNYRFSGWVDPQNGTMGNEDITIPGVWEYESLTVPSYRVFYDWTGRIPDGQTLPTDEKRYVPHQPYEVDQSYTAQTVIPDFDAYGNHCGNYRFSGWVDPQNGVMGNEDITIPGSWEYESISVPSYRVFYEWTGKIPDGQTLPTDENRYVPHQPYEVDQTYTDKIEIPTYDAFGNLNGKYTFSGWDDPQNGVMGNANITILGEWFYQTIPVKAYKVLYTWSGNIPDEETLPTDSNLYVPHQPYEVDQTYTAQTIIPDFDAYGNHCGNYRFGGWVDPQNGMMGNEDITIPGIWTYEPIGVVDYQVLYTWEGNIPDGQTLPTDLNRYVPNQPYEVDQTYTDKIEISTYDAFGNRNGKYTFSGWTDPQNGKMGNADVTIAGVWKYDSITILDHQVIYTWSGNIPDGQTLPTDENRYVPHQPYEVDQTYTDKIEIPTYDAFGNLNGKYTFSGWADPQNGVMGNEDITIPGIWEYKPISTPTYKVIYSWSGQVPAGLILPADENNYVTNQPYPVDTTFTKESKVELKNEAGQVYGRYTFSGWDDPQNGVMGNENILIPGVWSYEEILLPVEPSEPIQPPAPTPDPSPAPAPQPGTNPDTGRIPLETIFMLWLISASALLILGIIREKIVPPKH